MLMSAIAYPAAAGSATEILLCVEGWNAWRHENHRRLIIEDVKPDLTLADLWLARLGSVNLHSANLSGANLGETDLGEAILVDANLSGANLRKANLREANLMDACLAGAKLDEANLSEALLGGADLIGASLRRTILKKANLSQANLTGANLNKATLDEASLAAANLGGADLREASLRETELVAANFVKADLREADFYGASFELTNLSSANLREANLTQATLVRTDLTRADLTGCRIYGVSAWDLKLEGANQQNLIITPWSESTVSVDNIEVGQFIYLLLHNEKIRGVIDTIGKKGVLLLGRFTEGQMEVLERLRKKLRDLGFLPMVFNFDKPETKDFTETVRLLANLSKFVIVDITNPRSAPLELQAAVPDYMVPFVPILRQGEQPFAMFVDLQNKYDWVLKPVVGYASIDRLIEVLEDKVIRPAEAKFNELLARRTQQLRVENI
jgi:uncharacterized protein YjbI with pentapeptide repeats